MAKDRHPPKPAPKSTLLNPVVKGTLGAPYRTAVGSKRVSVGDPKTAGKTVTVGKPQVRPGKTSTAASSTVVKNRQERALEQAKKRRALALEQAENRKGKVMKPEEYYSIRRKKAHNKPKSI